MIIAAIAIAVARVAVMVIVQLILLIPFTESIVLVLKWANGGK